MSEDRCPTFLGYRFHRYPCAESGRIDDLTAIPTDQPEEVRCGGERRSGARDGLTCLAAVPPGWPHVPCVRPFKHEGEHSATPKWVDLFGIDPDYTGGQDVNEWLDESRGDA